jgi:hypothetical protein
MAVLPLDVHAGTGGDIYFNGLGICDWVHELLRPLERAYSLVSQKSGTQEGPGCPGLLTSLPQSLSGDERPLLSLCLYGWLDVPGGNLSLARKTKWHGCSPCLFADRDHHITISFVRCVIGCCISSRSPLTRFSPYTHDSNSFASLAKSGARRAYSNWSNLETM